MGEICIFTAALGLYKRRFVLNLFGFIVMLILLYRDAVCLDRDIIDSVGTLSARVNQEMPLCFFGTIDARETAELTLRMDDGGAGAAVRFHPGRLGGKALSEAAFSRGRPLMAGLSLTGRSVRQIP